MTPSTIRLIVTGRYDEAKAAGSIWPGMILTENTSNSVLAHNVAGGGGVLRVATENALLGLDITQKSSSSGDDGTPFVLPNKGDVLLCLLQNGQNVADQAPLMSAGDGTLILSTQAGANATLYEILAASTNITSTNTETTFSNGSYTIPANYLVAGDVLHIRARAVVTGQNSTNTHRIRTYLGMTVLADSTAISMAAADYYDVDLYVTVRSLGATGKFILEGEMVTTISGTATITPVTLGSTTLDTTASEIIKVTSLASATSSGNIIALQEFQIDLERTGGGNTLFTALEAIDNSGGTGTSGFNTAAFIRVQVN